ncbi:MAG: PQQ-binding-like beta-propeller repeat protein [bacterium]
MFFRYRANLSLAVLFGLLACRSSTEQPGSTPVAGTDRFATAFWRARATSPAARGTPATDGVNVYFLDGAHHVFAFDVLSGALRWQALTSSASGATYGQAGCVMTGGIVVCGDRQLVGFDPATGTRKWSLSGSFGEPIAEFSLFSANGTVYAGTGFNTMYAVDVASGSIRWGVQPLPAQTAQISFYNPIADGTNVVAGYTVFGTPSIGGVVCLDAATGAVRWNAVLPPRTGAHGGGGSTAFWKDRVLAASNDGQIHALRLSDGSLDFTLADAGPQPAEVGGGTPVEDTRNLTVQGNILVAGSENSYITGYDLNTHSVLWRVSNELSSNNAYRLVSDAEFAYTISIGKYLSAIRIATGVVSWTAGDGNNAAHGAVALWNDHVFVQADSGFYALRR